MIALRAAPLLLLLCLPGCSYVYDVRAELIDGQIVFTSDRDWFRQRCVRVVDVVAADRENGTEAEPGDDATRVGYGTYWATRVDYHCDNRFPVTYGERLQGQTQPDAPGGIVVAPKPLQRNVVYDVLTVSGATGYGSGQFMIRQDGTVVNLVNNR